MLENEDIKDEDQTTMLKLTSIIFVIFLSIVIYASKSSPSPSTSHNIKDGFQSLRSETSFLNTLSPFLIVVLVNLLFI